MDEEEEEEIIWEVKRVIDKRVSPEDGRVEYLLEWKKWDGPPTWEPLANCNCPSLIKKYEQQVKQQSQLQLQLVPTKSDLDIFIERKLKLQEILGAIRNPELSFIVKWRGIEQEEKIPLDILRKFYSQEVLDFLLKNLKWI